MGGLRKIYQHTKLQQIMKLSYSSQSSVLLAYTVIVGNEKHSHHLRFPPICFAQ